jgi:hypothetical protein
LLVKHFFQAPRIPRTPEEFRYFIQHGHWPGNVYPFVILHGPLDTASSFSAQLNEKLSQSNTKRCLQDFAKSKMCGACHRKINESLWLDERNQLVETLAFRKGDSMRKHRTLFALAAVIVMAMFASSQNADNSAPSYTKDGSLQLPGDYRTWVYLSSGLGMTYNANSNSNSNSNPMFTNVFVTPRAYQAFLNTGTWPDKTVFMLEERGSGTNTGPNRSGHFQTDLHGVATLVKDETRFPEKWRFFSFDTKDGLPVGPGKPVQTKACLECHTKNGAVDHTFVQFYPMLKRVAIEKGTYKEPPKE